MSIKQPKALVVIGDYRGVLMTFSEKSSLAIVPLINDVLTSIEECESYDKNKKYVYSRQGNNVSIMFNQLVFNDLLWEIRVRVQSILEELDLTSVLIEPLWCDVKNHQINRSVEVINPAYFIQNLNQLVLEKKLEIDFNLAATSLLSAYGHSFIESEIKPEDRYDTLAIAELFKSTVTYDDGTPIQGLDYSIYGPHILLFIKGNEDKLIGYLNCRVSGDRKFFSLLLKGFMKNESIAPNLPTKISNWLNSIGIPADCSAIDRQLAQTILSPNKETIFNVNDKRIRITYSARQMDYAVQVGTPDEIKATRIFSD